MEFQQKPGHIYATNSTGTMIAEVVFPIADGIATINRTFTDESLRGQGVADKLMQAAVEQIRSNGLKAHLVCPYAIKWFERHPEHSDLL